MYYNINSNKTDFALEYASSEQRYSSQSPRFPGKTNKPAKLCNAKKRNQNIKNLPSFFEYVHHLFCVLPSSQVKLHDTHTIDRRIAHREISVISKNKKE